MAKLFKKDLYAVAAVMAKAAHRAVNGYCIGEKFIATPGFVGTHSHTPKTPVEWEGFTLEVSACRRPRVVCNVPTPFSLFTFNYCLKRDGKQLAHGQTLPEFADNAFRAINKVMAD